MLFSVFWSRSQAFFGEGPKPNFWVGSGSYFVIKNITVTFEKKTSRKYLTFSCMIDVGDSFLYSNLTSTIL